MKLSVRVKYIFSLACSTLGILQWKIKRRAAHQFAILMYHRIIPKGGDEILLQPGMYVAPDTFECHLQFLKDNFRILPLSEILLNPNKKSDTGESKPLCYITFDDGWQDLYNYAFPLLKAYQVSATVFLPTDFIGTNNWFWTDRLAYLLSQKRIITYLNQQNTYSNHPLITKLLNLKGSHSNRLEKAIELFKTYRHNEIEEALSELVLQCSVDLAPLGRAFLTWNEVKEMSESGLISFGSHTAHHRILITLNDDEIYDELKTSKEKLIAEKVVVPSFIPLCYPNGNYTEKIATMVEESGYTLAVTTESGWNSTNSNPFQLRRIGIHQDMTSHTTMLACKIIGLF